MGKSYHTAILDTTVLYTIRLNNTQHPPLFLIYSGTMTKKRQVAIMAERSSAYGRSFIGGVADVAEEHPDWELSLMEPAPITPKEAKAFDAWICRIADSESAAALAASNRPVVDCLCTAANSNFATVRTDAAAIGQLAAEHLLTRHFANFAFCGYRRVAFSDRRRNSFTQCLEAKGFRPAIYRPPLRKRNRFGRDFLLGDRLESPPDADDLANWLMRLPKPIGIFCCDDLRASQVRSICRELSLVVPDDIAILGVDDDPIYCMFTSPRLSSIDPDSAMIGRTAAETLAEWLAAPEGYVPPNRIVSPKGIVARASTDTMPGTPGWVTEAYRFIRMNASGGISASDVFSHVGFSRTLVEKRFKDLFGQTVQTVIAESRIAEACRLLETTTLPIKEIASRSGFASIEYFSRAFAAAKGIPATTWRETNRSRNA